MVLLDCAVLVDLASRFSEIYLSKITIKMSLICDLRQLNEITAPRQTKLKDAGTRRVSRMHSRFTMEFEPNRPARIALCIQYVRFNICSCAFND